MSIINLTPHQLSIHTPQGVVAAPPSGEIARVSSSRRKVGEFEGIELWNTSYGEVTGLPEPAEGTLYVVSGMVRGAVPSRLDVASPGELLRGPDGQPIGCGGLNVNKETPNVDQ